MSKAFSAFYNDLLPELPGCSTGMLDLQLLRVAREFCERSGAWREPMLPITSQAGVKTYALFSPEPKTDVVRVLELSVDGRLLWRAEPIVDPTASEQPKFMPQEPPFTLDAQATEITLSEEPTGAIEGMVAMRPSFTATTLPDVMQSVYLEALRSGVFARLMAMGGKPWTDRSLAGYHEQRWQAALDVHATRATRGYTKAPLRTRLSPL
jgi:hypothetical protein